MKVLSLFDGISCARVALEKAKIPVEEYFASEIDKYAVQTALKNYPSTIQVGDVRGVNDKWIAGYHNWGLDLLIGGSPCQDLSVAKKNREGLKGARSGLFYEYLRILREMKPKYFILENVASMPQEAKEEISRELGVQPILINAALVSAQTRKRLFWTNILNVVLPEDRGIYLKDILLEQVDEKYICTNINNWRIYKSIRGGNEKSKALTATMFKGSGNDGMTTIRVGTLNSGGQGDRSVALSANGGGRGAKTGLYEVYGKVRRLTPMECERLQCVPDNYTAGCSDTQRYKMLGNAFNADVVAHILSFIK